jgi:hypothetical protein
MLRADVVQGFLNRFTNPSYLEVGVESGVTFHALNAHRKVAVDPRFAFQVPEPRITQAVEYHEVLSDDYFGGLGPETEKFDVIYLDGLHTAEQTLRDILNSVEYLADNGVLVIDDVLPTTYSSSLPSVDDVLLIRSHRPPEAADESWMGDIYRLVFFVESLMQGYSYATVKENHGQLVMWRAQRKSVLNPAQTLTQIGSLDFANMLRRLPEFRIMPYTDIMQEYSMAAMTRTPKGQL